MRYRAAGIALVALLGLTGATRALFVDRRPTVARRGPISVPNSAVTPPDRRLVGSVRHLTSRSAPEALVLDTVFPDRPTRLLWFAGRPAAPLPDGAVTTDGTGGVVRVDAHLRARALAVRPRGHEIASIAPAGDGGWWLASAGGEILRADRTGLLLPLGGQAPFRYPELAPSPDGGFWTVRSPERMGFGWHHAGAPPLVHVRSDGHVSDSVGRAVVPPHALLMDLANAGRIAVAGDTVWYAPLVRDQVIAFGPGGDTLWVASRGLNWATRPPRFEIVAGKPEIRYAPVNFGVALGPDGRLYVLGARDSLDIGARLDVFDRTTGGLLRSGHLTTRRPTLAVDDSGRVHLLEESRLLTGVAVRERPGFPDFDLERLGGGRMTLAALRGSVTLINFWASWCTPCRTEMPSLDSMRRSIGDPAFAFVTIDEDVRQAEGARFIAEFGFDFPVLRGGGRMQARYHYPGLPYTVVLDREGRTVQRWFGYAGPAQIDEIRRVIAAELAR